MNKLKFLSYINNPETLKEKDLVQLQALAQQYPFCQIIHMLIAKGRHDLKLDTFNPALHRAAIYAHDRNLLKKLIEHVLVAGSMPIIEPSEPSAEKATESVVEATVEPASETPGSQKIDPVLPADYQNQATPEPSIESKPETITSDQSGSADIETSEINTQVETGITNPPVIEEDSSLNPKASSKPGGTEATVKSDLQKEGTQGGIHEELMANLEKRRQQRDLLGKEENREASSDGNAKVPDEDKDQSTTEPGPDTTPIIEEPVAEGLEKIAKEAAGESANGKKEAKTSPEEDAKLKQQMELIDSFIKRSPVLSKPNLSADSEGTSQTDLSVSSTKFSNEFISENLANILAKQGKRKDAVGIYEKLMAKFPEKRAYFADQIENIKK